MKKLVTMFVGLVAATTIFAGSVTVSWNTPTNTAGVDGYRIYYLRTPTNDLFSPTNPNMVMIYTTNVLATNVVISNLTNGLIRARVTAFTGNPTNQLASVESIYSNEASTNLLFKPNAPWGVSIISVTSTNQ